MRTGWSLFFVSNNDRDDLTMMVSNVERCCVQPCIIINNSKNTTTTATQTSTLPKVVMCNEKLCKVAVTEDLRRVASIGPALPCLFGNHPPRAARMKTNTYQLLHAIVHFFESRTRAQTIFTDLFSIAIRLHLTLALTVFDASASA